MRHVRVVPRDFFNESKLLKCLGKLQIHIMENPECRLTSVFDGKPFEIIQHDSDGSLTVLNFTVYKDGEPIALYTPYNSKEDWPLYALFRGEEYSLLRENGELMPSLLTEKERSEK